MKNGIKILSTMIAYALYSQSSFAAGMCTAGQSMMALKNGSNYQSECPSEKAITKLSGRAEVYISDFEEDIASAGEAIADEIAAGTNDIINSHSKMTQDLTKTILELGENRKELALDIAKSQQDREMNFLTEMAEKQAKADRAITGFSDTAEGMSLIMYMFLSQGDGNADDGYIYSQEVIEAIKQQFPAGEYQQPVALKITQDKLNGQVCAPYDPKVHLEGGLDPNCFEEQPTNLGAAAEYLWGQCNVQKSIASTTLLKNAARATSKKTQRKKLANYEKAAFASTGGVEMQKNLENQTSTSCSLIDMENGLCIDQETGKPMEETAYIEKVINNEIVPNGNVSSTNLLTPASVGSVDGDLGDISEEELKSIEVANQVNRDESGEMSASEAVSDNTPPLINTYRTSSQYYAAEDMVSNIVGREAVSGLSLKERTMRNTELQSKMLSRNAALSVAENSLRKPIESRMGVDLTAAVASGELTRDEVLREGLSGASTSDRLTHSINQEYTKLSTTAKDAVSGGGIAEFTNAPPAKLQKMQIDALVTGLKLKLQRLERLERQEINMATLVALEANSPENVEYIKELKSK